MEADERAQERNETRLDQHGERLATMEQAYANLNESVKREAATTRQQLSTYFKPMLDTSMQNAKDIVGVKKDLGWVVPWVKKILYGSGVATAGALIYQIITLG